MNFEKMYKQQMDICCDQTIVYTATDIFKTAKAREQQSVAEEQQEVKKVQSADIISKENEESKKKKSLWAIYQGWELFYRVAVPVACLFFLCTTIYATSESISYLTALIREKTGDDITADIAEEGYVSEINLTESAGVFDVTLIAISGDELNPQLVFQIKINDEEICANNEEIEADVAVMGAQQFETEKENYMPVRGVAKQDTENPSLYYMTVEAAPAWFVNPGENIVVYVSQIFTEMESTELVSYDVNMEFRFGTMDFNTASVITAHYSNIDADHYNRVCELERIEYSDYKCNVVFRYVENGMSHEGRINLAKLFLDEQDVALVVDGEVYKPIISGATGEPELYAQSQYGEGRESKWYDLTVVFPAIDYEAAESIALRVDDVLYELK